MRTSVLLLIVLIPYFLFQTGFVYEMTKGDSWSVPLSKYRMNAFRLYGQTGYSDAYSVSGAQWLSNAVAFGHGQIYSDYSSGSVELRMYTNAYLRARYVELVSNTTEVKPGGLVYLGPLSITQQTVIGANYLWNLTESHVLDGLSKIYSNGRAEAYTNGQ